MGWLVDLTFAVLATLPLGLLTVFRRRDGAVAEIFGLALAPLLKFAAPALWQGAQSLIGHKKAKGEEKKKIEFERQKAEAEEAAARSKFDAAQDSPAAAVQRLKFNTKLAQILGKFGGREKTPGFITGAFDTARKRAEYTPGAQFVAPQTSGGGFWGAAGGIADALSYLDPSQLKGAKKAPMSPGQPVGGGSRVGAFETGIQKPASGIPFDPRLGRNLFK
jgi:hypothetical protein